MSNPVVAPVVNAANVEKATEAVVAATKSYIPAKVRATLYSVAGVVGVAAGAIAPIIGGQVGTALDIVAAAAAVGASTLAVSHLGK